MSVGRNTLALVLATALVACGGDSGGSAPPIGGEPPAPAPPAPTPAPSSAQCSLADRQEWVRGQIEQFYLFPDLLDLSVDPGNFDTVQGYIDALVAPARAQDRDRFFTYITSIEEENELINSGSSAGFGVRLAFDAVNTRLLILEAFENGPGFAAGVDRGTQILAINGRSVDQIVQQGGTAALSEALGPSDPGVTRTLRFRQRDGTTVERDVTKAEFALDPVSDRYGSVILDDSGKQVGYINLRTFIVENAGPQLRTAIDDFRQRGITEVILDFRYNGGGLISVAQLLGDLLGRDKTGQVFSRTVFRESLSENNSTELFEARDEAIAATKIAVIGTGSTASASELVANSFIPYLGNNTALIGSNTFGKPVGQIARDRPVCDDRLRVVALRTVNAEGGGDYYSGLATVFPRTCQAQDDISQPLGSPNEASIATSLDFLGGRSCNPITASGTKRAQGASNARALQSQTPSAAQHRVPGLF